MRRTISTGKRWRFSTRAAPAIVALVRALDEKLVEQIAFPAHDLDAVVAGVLRDNFAQCTKSRIVRSTPRADSARGLNGVIGDLISDGATDSG